MKRWGATVLSCLAVAAVRDASVAHPLQPMRGLPVWSVRSPATSDATMQLSRGFRYRFQGTPDGSHPDASLAADSTGALYGTTFYGGSRSLGSVFKLAPSPGGYTETILTSFLGGHDGANPWAGVLVDADGTIYGTTLFGGAANLGTVYELVPSPSGYEQRLLYSFKGGQDGAIPYGTPILDADGTLYGTTLAGGAGTNGGNGTVFQLKRSGPHYVEAVLYRFRAGVDGANPCAGLTHGAGGALFGTTSLGGSGPSGGDGTVFRLSPSGRGYRESVLYRFRGGADGEVPRAGLIADNAGTLYGTTAYGGGIPFAGTAFALVPSGKTYKEAVLHRFGRGADGKVPLGTLVADTMGNLYGTTEMGGASGAGAVFKLSPVRNGYAESILHDFAGGQDGANPTAGLLAANGALYGTTSIGGVGLFKGDGVAFGLRP